MEELIQKLRALNITLDVQDNNLVLGNIENGIPDNLLQELKSKKEVLISYLRGYSAKSEKEDIEPVAKSLNYELSPSQYRLWILSQSLEASIAYNMPTRINLDESFQIAFFESAFKIAIERHEILRTVFKEDDAGVIKQWILGPDSFDFTVAHKDLSVFDNTEERLEAYIQEDMHRAFDLENGPLLRLSLIKTSNKQTTFFLNMHHIISDGMSMRILSKEILSYYNVLKNGDTPANSPLSIQFKDYAAWEKNRVTTVQYQKDKAYWMEEFNTPTTNLNLPSRQTRPAIKTTNGHAISTFLSQYELQGLSDYRKRNGGSLFMCLLAVFKVVCHKYTSESDITIGTPVLGREQDSLLNQIGFYVNTIALRSAVKKEESFDTFYQQLKGKLIQSYEHQSYPFDVLVKELDLFKDISRNPLFDVVVVFNDLKGEMMGQDSDTNHLRNTIFDLGIRPAKFDLDITLNSKNQGLEIEFVFNSNVYTYKEVESFLKHYKELITEIADHSSIPLKKLEIITGEEKSELLSPDHRLSDFQKEETIVSIFEKIAVKNPENVAVTFGDQSLDYKELDKLSNQFADYLRKEHKIDQNGLIAVSVERSQWLLVVIMGVLKTGNAYVPIDPSYPQNRIDYITENAQCEAIIREKELKNFLNHINTFESVKTSADINSSSLAYVIYTSGSTGKPKGVTVTHANLISLLFPNENLFDFGSEDVWMLFHSYSFDFSVWEIFGALLYGAKLVVLETVDAKDTHKCWEMISKEGVTVLNQTPSSFYALLDVYKSKAQSHKIRYIIFGGEALYPNRLTYWYERNPETQLINMYGITETTIHVTYKKLTAEDIQSNESRIGWFLPTLKGYVLDEDQKLLPKGIPGELYVAGHGVAQGYLNDPKLTNQRFIENPYRENEKLYKSGDRVMFSLDHDEILYLGRVDQQVKIRGFRIELGEIENTLLKHTNIQNAAVVAKEIEGEKQLVTYLISDEVLTIAELRIFLSEFLPDHMIPVMYYTVDQILLTSNGKLDTKALDTTEKIALELGVQKVAPTNDIEIALVNIWTEILDKKDIGVVDDFFLLGGDSIKLIRLLNNINTKLDCQLNASDLYTHSTIRSLANHIMSGENGQETSSQWQAIHKEIEELKDSVLSQIDAPKLIEDVYPMSDIQKGMLFASVMNKGMGVYHDQFLYPFTVANFQQNIFEQTLDLLVQKHSIFRTTFNLEIDEEDVQIVLKDHETSIRYISLEDQSQKDRENYIRAYVARKRQVDFDIKSPLWRMTMFSMNENDNVLLFEFHHAILDGWSVASFIQELTATYYQVRSDNSYSPKSLVSTYKEMVLQEKYYKQTNAFETFWKSELNGYEKLNIFNKQDIYQTEHRSLSTDFTQKLRQFAEDHQVPVKTIMLGAYSYLLRFLVYENDVTIGLVGNNRPIVEDGDKILGCFLNTLPFRYVFDQSNETVTEFLKNIHQKTIERKNAEKATLVDLAKLMEESSANKNPFFDVTFNYTDFHIIHDAVLEEKSFSENEVNSLESYERTNTFFDLTIDAKSSRKINLLFCLTRELKSRISPAELMTYYEAILEYLVSYPNEMLNDIQLLDPVQQKELLIDFNSTERTYEEGSVIQMFKNQVIAKPEEIAVVFESNSLTYQELDELSNQFANHLIEKYAVNSKDLVAVQLLNSEWFVVCLLGILKSGAAYIPIDPNYPQDRVNMIKEDSDCKVCIDAEKMMEFRDEREGYSVLFEDRIIALSQLAYIIYTSGSTGKPKGVMIEHKSLKNYVCWAAEIYGQQGGLDLDFGIFTSVAFDLTVTSMYLPLISGYTVTIFPSDRDTSEVLKSFLSRSIPNMKVTPAFVDLFEEMKSEEMDINTAILGGDILQSNHIQTLQSMNPEMRIFNEYGPTETTVGSSYYQIQSPSEEVLVGKPIANTQIYMLNKNRQLVPKGVEGELYIGGAGVSIGYFNREELTKQKFIESPFIEGERLFKSGDLGFWTQDGNIKLIGRIDDQVKIKGYRIELGEIEQCLLSKEDIREVVALVKIVHDSPAIVAFYVADEVQDLGQLRKFLAQKLPAYMIPNLFYALDELPLTTNGKIAKEELLKIDGAPIISERLFVAPSNPIEKELVEIWSKVLHIDANEISASDDFFHLGGDSLKATKAILLINSHYEIEINLKDLFEEPTIRNIAEIIETLELLKTSEEETLLQDDELIF